MQKAGIVLAAFLAIVGGANGLPDPQAAGDTSGDGPLRPTVTIATGTVIGRETLLMTETFNGIPYALPPTGDLRLRRPVRLNSSIGTFDGGPPSAACPQMGSMGVNFPQNLLDKVAALKFFQKPLNISEDCLTIDVARPKGTKAGDKLPVLFWIFSSGFESGWSSEYDGSELVKKATINGKPYVFVGVNYRVGGFGFLPGAEVLADGAANLGLLDQRMGLEWVADNIDAFGGDATKVVIGGESAGAISVLDQMLLYGGNITYNGAPLFRGAIMSSGSIAPTNPIDGDKGQATFDQVASRAGCESAKDKMACLRAAPFDTFLNATNSVPYIWDYNSLALSYCPRPDGTVLPASPDVMVANGQYTAVPMIVGDQEDEGTVFAMTPRNVTTSDRLAAYLNTVFFHDATIDQMTSLVATYEDSASAGSPFNTGIMNQIRPGFKRLAAVLGDLVFTLTRRLFLSLALAKNPNVPAWSYLSSYGRNTPVLGTFHGSDLLHVFYDVFPDYASESIQNYFANFVWNLDPNDASGGDGKNTSAVDLVWPKWEPAGRQLMQFWRKRGNLLRDDFRSASFDWIVANINVLRM